VSELDENPDRALTRFEFLECLIRLGGVKYKDSGKVNTYNEALDLLMTEDVYPHCPPIKWQQFRDEELWTIEVNDILEANLGLLLQLFNKFTNNQVQGNNRSISMRDAIDLFVRLTPVSLTYN
jgi:NLR family CARD domain-containing protein 3